jgi:hypothetical protein
VAARQVVAAEHGVAVRQVVPAHGMAEVEPVRPDNKLSGDEVEPRDGVTERTVRASVTDRREVER